MAKIELVAGDITAAAMDAIVNAANPVMLGGGGVDGAIHRAAGPDLLEACRKIPVIDGIRCPTGEARITHGGNLPATYVIHTVGPVYHQESNPAALLESAYSNSLNLALGNQCASVAFPAISCGVFGYPLDEAARIAVDVCSRDDFGKLAVSFYLFGDEIMSAWEKALAKA